MKPSLRACVWAGCVVLGLLAQSVAALDIVTTVAGDGANTDWRDGIAATAASIAGLGDSGNSVAVDGSGNIYLAESGRNMIRKVAAADGTISTVAGTGGYGYNGDGIQATAATLAKPGGIAVDNSGNLFIADTENHRIRKVDAAGVITTVAGDGYIAPDGRGRFNGDGTATAVSLNEPCGVFVAGATTLYIADTGNGRVRSMDLVIGNLATVAGGGAAPGPDFGDGGSATSAQLLEPTGVFDNGGIVYIADPGMGRVRKVDAGTIFNVAGDPAKPPGYSGDGAPAALAQLDQPAGVVVDSGGNIFISDQANSRIRMVNGTGDISTIAGTGVKGFGGDTKPALSAVLKEPSGLAIDGSDNLYIADEGNLRVRVIDKATGNINTKAGNGSGAYAGDGGAATSASFRFPNGAAADAASNVYIADSGNHCIRKIDASGVIATVAGNGMAGFAGDGGAATSAQLDWPDCVFVASNGDLYIADTDNDRVRKVSGGTIATIAGGGAPGPGSPAPGDGGPATSACLDEPESVVVDGSGNVYIAECMFVRKVDASGTISTYAGNGQPPGGPIGDGGAATQAALYEPNGLALDSAGNLFIADSGHHRIRKVDTSGVITTVAGTGTRGFSGDGGAATAATLAYPNSVAVDSAGNLFIADQDNQRIRKVDTAGTITTIAGTGVPGFAGDGGDALKAQFFHPQGVAVSDRGLLVADTGSNRIRRIRHNNPPVVNNVAVSQDPAKVNTDVTFTADATDADSDPLTYTWSAETLQPVVTQATSVTLQFATPSPPDRPFTGTLTVSDGYETATSTGTITVVAPSSGGAGVANISNGETVTNPVNGITIQVASSDGGIIELLIDINAVIREDYYASTDFTDVPGRAGTGVKGPRPVHQFVQTGVFVATTNAIETATGQSKGKARKTLPISRKETGQEQDVTGDPPSPDIKMKNLKGKFLFKKPVTSKPVPDLVSFSGTFALAAGLDLSKEHEVALGIGNITDTTIVSPKGKGSVPSKEERIKKLSVKYPRLKGTTFTSGGETARFDVTLSMADMSPAGFDTEGVTPEATDLNSKNTAPRSIQVAVVLAGVSYEVMAPVNFKLSTKKDVGQILPARTGQ